MMDDFPSFARAVLRAGCDGVALAGAGARAAWSGLVKFEARLERRVDRFIDTGWRKGFGWLGLLVAAFSYIYAPLHNIPVDYVHVDIFLSFATGMYLARGLEKHARDRMAAMGLPLSGQGMGPGAAAGVT